MTCPECGGTTFEGFAATRSVLGPLESEGGRFLVPQSAMDEPDYIDIEAGCVACGTLILLADADWEFM